jgi:hypothetical protein
MKLQLIIWLGVELLVASGISAVSCILRRDEVEAFGAWRNNPTTENRSELERQRSITYRHYVGVAGVLWSVMAVITIAVVIAVSRRRSRQANETQLQPPPNDATEHQ